MRIKDSEIIRRIEQGDERILDHLYQRHYRMMVNMVLKNSGTEDEAKDIYQEALVVFWQKVTQRKLTLTSKISTYLYSICRNLWHKELERKARHGGEFKDASDESYESYEQQERVRIIRDCIAELPEACQRVLTYYYFERLSMQDIADKLGFANADTAKSKKYKCKKELDKLVKTRFKASDFLD